MREEESYRGEQGKLGTEKSPFTRKSQGSGGYAWCRCHTCGTVAQRTPSFNYYTISSTGEDWLYCETCLQKHLKDTGVIRMNRRLFVITEPEHTEETMCQIVEKDRTAKRLDDQLQRIINQRPDRLFIETTLTPEQIEELPHVKHALMTYKAGQIIPTMRDSPHQSGPSKGKDSHE